MASPKGFAAVTVAVLLLDCAFAATIIVGAPNGSWDLSTDLGAWASSQTFSVGDTLVFQYGPTHDVLEVTKANFDGCISSSPISTDTGGNTPISLASAGKRYFICGVGNHCSSGMKIEVDVTAATPATPPAASTPPPPSGTPSTPPSASSPGVKSPPGTPPPPPNSAVNGSKMPLMAKLFCWILIILAV